MPTITSATTIPLMTGAPAKAPASLLVGGEPMPDFQTLLGATSLVAQPVEGDGAAADPTLRQPVAGGGTALPADIAAVIVPGATPIDVMPAVKPTAGAPSEKPTPDAPSNVVPLFAPVPAPTPRQLPGAAPHDADADADEQRDHEDTTAPIDVPQPLSPAPLVAPLQPVHAAATRPAGAKTSPLPLISIARPAPPPSAPPAAIPQIGRDIRWERAAPAATPLAPAPQPPTQPTAPAPALVARAPSAPSAEDAPVTVIQPPSPSPPAALPIPAVAVSMPPPVVVVGPALHVFGPAISAAAQHERREQAADPVASLGSIAPAATSIAAPATTAGEPMLDMRQERWPQAMIAHIEALRDTADAGDTRIRLIPDALGTIDVAVTRDRDTVHVQFTAEQAATRTLIQDAQPRLAALAEERGLRLGQTVVDAGAGSAAQQSPHQRQPQRDSTLPSAPRRAPTHDDQDRADDGRLA